MEKDTDLFVHLMLDAIKSNILNILDLRKYAERRAMENANVMADIFSKIGRAECRFIEQSGFVFGFLFGCIQVRFILFEDICKLIIRLLGVSLCVFNAGYQCHQYNLGTQYLYWDKLIS